MNLIECESLTKQFSEVKAVDSLSFQVPEGSVSGLLGANGSGKTTSIRILLGLSSASSGKVSLLGKEPGKPGFAEAIHQTGSLIEGPALFGNATARDNMMVQALSRGIKSPNAEIAELLDFVGLKDWADKRSKIFSLGMKQRLGIAIALLGKPKVVILDEPTNGLDPAGIVEIRELIKSLPERGTTVFVSSHLLSEVELMCDRATIIDHGRLVADGSIADIIRSSGGEESFSVHLDLQDIEKAQQLLGDNDLRIEPGDMPDRLRVFTGDGQLVSKTLGGQQIFLKELRKETLDLEDAFLSLTNSPPEPPEPGKQEVPK